MERKKGEWRPIEQIGTRFIGLSVLIPLHEEIRQAAAHPLIDKQEEPGINLYGKMQEVYWSCFKSYLLLFK